MVFCIEINEQTRWSKKAKKCSTKKNFSFKSHRMKDAQKCTLKVLSKIEGAVLVVRLVKNSTMLLLCRLKAEKNEKLLPHLMVM